MKSFILMLALGATLAACSKSNNVLLGRVEATVNSHKVVVTDCYRTSVPASTSETGADGVMTYRFAPCKDAVLALRDGELTVNGKGYGKLAETDSVTVDHGKVLINDHDALVVANN